MRSKLTAEVVTPPAHGQLVLKPTGSFTYIPDPSFAGRDAFTYRVKDAAGHFGNVGRVDLAANLVSFKAGAVKASEKGPAKVVLTLAHPATAPLTVGYLVAPGTAGPDGQDFTLADGTVSFAAGEKSKTIVIPLTNDALYEGTETFQVWLLDPGGDTAVGKYHVVTVSIRDNEKPPAVSFRVKASTASEGATATIEVFLSAPSALPVTVEFGVKLRGTTATPGTDFDLSAGTLTFAPSETSKTLLVPLIDDAVSEPAEKVVVVLSKPTGAKLKGITTHTLTIDDNDP